MEKLLRALRNPDKMPAMFLNGIARLYHERVGRLYNKYNLKHLTQSSSQKVLGPIQDDEALFLYSIIRGMRLSRILEVGGSKGYSARNFLAAIKKSKNPILYTVDLYRVPKMANNHKIIIKNAEELTSNDLDNKPLDLVFFDCHEYDVQMNVYKNLLENKIITEDTILTLHDTNLHPQKQTDSSYKVFGGYVHQEVERKMVNTFKDLGYDIFSLHTKMYIHDQKFPFRHGVSVCSKFKKLEIK